MREIDVDRLKKCCCITGKYGDNFQSINLKKLGEIIDAQPTSSNWIPISKKLPEDGQKAIVTLDNDYVEELIFKISTTSSSMPCWVNMGFDYYLPLSRVKAWMPLPEPY